MDLVTGAMGSLLLKLGELLKAEYNLHKGLKEQVRSLSLELESAQAALRKVAQVPLDQLDEQVLLWARDMREASYDMEDILDMFLVGVQGGHDEALVEQHGFNKMAKFFKKSKESHKVASAIENIKKYLQEVSDRRGRYKVDDVVVKPAATLTIDPRLAAMYKEVTQIIGIDKSRDEIILRLSSKGSDVSSKKMKTVSIVGVGGLGKTTLAKAVYDKLKIYFNCWAFIPIGRNPDVKKVLKDILIDLDKNHCNRNFNLTMLDERQLIEELREFLINKRYFVVIDDIWDTPTWEVIKMAFVQNTCGSRIIITTRNFEVAKKADDVYNLQPLDHESSKILFHTKVFGGDGNFPGNQVDGVSNKILEKCGGVPLAIITMASLLEGKPREEWPEVYGSIGFGHNNKDVENTMKILSFSYYDLPSHLRTCLLHLSQFPEDYVIEKNPLIWMWIAEGFILEKQGVGFADIGEGYFNDLVNRSMILVEESKHERTVVGCRIHDMVLDFIRSMSHKENFVTTLHNGQGSFSQMRVRRLGYQNRITPYEANHMDMSHVRSFISYRCDIDKWVPLSTFKLLRVLAIEDCDFMDGCHLKHLGRLLHLRFLSLRQTRVRELPKEIAALKLLQVLFLKGSSIKELPSSMEVLTKLVCLRGDCWITRAPDWIGKLTSLEELEIYPGDDDKSKRSFVKEIGNLRKLRVLRTGIDVMDESMQRDLVESLGNLHKIQRLKLLTLGGPKAVDVGILEAAGFALPRYLQQLIVRAIRFSRLPSCINPPCLPNLSHLYLDVETMDEQDVKLLGRLTELRYLWLVTGSTVTVRDIDARCFKKLRFWSWNYAMVQFFVTNNNKDNPSISFHTWNGSDGTPFVVSSKRDNCSIAPTLMPSLQELWFAVHVRAFKDGNSGGCGSLGLEYLPSLQSVRLYINCQGASIAEVEEVEAALRNANSILAKRPVLDLHRYNPHN